ncbi:flagellar operon protein [Sporolactobacillus sp. THM7-4]|nr:flagellar operon protein [Sporolactobacillus sp. THM7-4]
MSEINRYTYYPMFVAGQIRPAEKATGKSVNRQPFEHILKNELKNTPVKLTKHAKERLAARNIRFSVQEWNTIHEKMKQAKKMGVHESLVLTKDAALVVNTQKNTVITAMDLEETKTHIFTNINGTIVINH